MLFITTCWWPSFARLAHVFAVGGCRVTVVCPPGHPVAAAPSVTVIAHRAFRPMRAIADAIAACQPDLLVPGDDRSVGHLHQLHRTGSAAERALVERSLGAPVGYGTVMSRIDLIALARSLDIPVPADHRVDDPAGLSAWMDRVPGPWVIKRDGAWAGAGVRIAATPAEAIRARRKLRAAGNPLIALKRVLVNRDPFWLADWLRRRPPVISAQAHIEGWPGNLAMFCQDGEVLAVAVAEAVACWGAHRPVHHHPPGRPAGLRSRRPAPGARAAPVRLPRPGFHGRAGRPAAPC